jgi:type 1 glutamine amidotransferase
VTTSSGSALSYNRVVVDASSPNDAWAKSTGDLNGDGLPDLIVGGASGPMVWYQAPGWTKRQISGSGGTESGSAAGDIDGDGDVDVVVGTLWYENVNGDGLTWTTHTLPSAGTHDIRIFDINNDGKNDVIMRGETTSPVSVFLQGGTKDTWTAFSVNPGIGRNGLDIVDLNGDNLADIVVGGVWVQNPGGNVAVAAWQNHTFTTGWDDFAAVKVVDMDSDGHPDIVLSVSEGTGKLSWFKAPANATSANWAETNVAASLTLVHGITVSDVDHDGRLDIAVSEYSGQNRLIVYLQTSGGGWQENVIGTDRLHNMQAADFNNDGNIDFFGVYAYGVSPVIVYQSTAPSPANRVLVFSRTLGFRHDSIPAGITAIQQLGAANNFAVDASEDPAVFTPANLSQYRALVFLNPSGDILNSSQRLALEQFVKAGGGFVGIHNANADTLVDWAWYKKLVGAFYVSEINTTPMTLTILNTTHISTVGLPNPWTITSEAYNYDVNPKVNGARVLINLNDTTVSGGTMGADHPFSWYHPFDGGRSWYTVGGANISDYSDANWRAHILGGIRYAGAF